MSSRLSEFDLIKISETLKKQIDNIKKKKKARKLEYKAMELKEDENDFSEKRIFTVLYKSAYPDLFQSNNGALDHWSTKKFNTKQTIEFCSQLIKHHKLIQVEDDCQQDYKKKPIGYKYKEFINLSSGTINGHRNVAEQRNETLLELLRLIQENKGYLVYPYVPSRKKHLLESRDDYFLVTLKKSQTSEWYEVIDVTPMTIIDEECSSTTSHSSPNSEDVVNNKVLVDLSTKSGQSCETEEGYAAIKLFERNERESSNDTARSSERLENQSKDGEIHHIRTSSDYYNCNNGSNGLTKKQNNNFQHCRSAMEKCTYVEGSPSSYSQGSKVIREMQDNENEARCQNNTDSGIVPIFTAENSSLNSYESDNENVSLKSNTQKNSNQEQQLPRSYVDIENEDPYGADEFVHEALADDQDLVYKLSELDEIFPSTKGENPIKSEKNLDKSSNSDNIFGKNINDTTEIMDTAQRLGEFAVAFPTDDVINPSMDWGPTGIMKETTEHSKDQVAVTKSNMMEDHNHIKEVNESFPMKQERIIKRIKRDEKNRQRIEYCSLAKQDMDTSD
ncbi:DgyrCDS3942 [Dimorphilus gyrociliatus]|uniref:DgyrCDS3942 n=1 Tax=Dimorphilus gyrociliatus TaxID=2664684 RepID=A0A7I8VFE9_9ANNE|nr:DgyrCDS3942 [Dimorphilus gyrociliatus]